MTKQEKETLSKVSAALAAANIRINVLNWDNPDEVFITACMVLDSLKPAIQAHREANHAAHRLVK